MKYFAFAPLALYVVLMACFITEKAGAPTFYRVKTGEELDRQTMVMMIGNHLIVGNHKTTVVLGETHYDKEVQDMEAQLIRGVVKDTSSRDRVAVGWEFLDSTDQEEIDSYWATTPREQFTAHFVKHSETYVPVMKAVGDTGGRLLGLNITSEQKARLATALDHICEHPQTDFYRERFEEAMGGHAQGADLYQKQLLTDCVMAAAIQAPDYPLKFMVVGSFHTMYGDGVVAQLKAQKGSHVVNVLITKEEPELIHPRYGAVADYVVVVRESPLARVRKWFSVNFP